MAPDSCEDEDVTYRKMAKTATIPKLKDWYLEKAEVRFYSRPINCNLNAHGFQARATSPIAVRRVREGWEGEDFVSMIWIRAKNMPKEKRDVAYQKVSFLTNSRGVAADNLLKLQCVLGYMSDIHLWVAPFS